MITLLICIFITQTKIAVYGQTYEEMDNLLGNLFNESRYNKLVRPLHNQSHVIKVHFTQHLTSIERFEISTGEIVITGFFEIRWVDELISWDPSSFGSKEIILLPEGKFWKPEFFLRNGDAYENTAIDNSGFSPSWASYQGHIIMIPAGSYKTRCIVDTTLFPFDTHECKFQFTVSNYGISELLLYSPTGDLDTSDFKENGEWEIEKTKATVVLVKVDNIDNLSLPMVHTSFSLKRRPAFECVNNYAPISLLSILNLCICFIRPDSGERLSFAVTLYLSLVFASAAVIENIPNNSLKMPFVSYDILILNFINTAGVIWSIFIVHLATIKHIRRRLPAFVVKKVMKNRQLCQSDNRIHSDETSAISTELKKDEEHLHESKSNTKQKSSLQNTDVNDITGLELADVCDKIYFWFVFLCLSAVNFAFLSLFVMNWNKS